MLCGAVVLISCACIWISFSSKLPANTFAAPAVDELSVEPVLEEEFDEVVPLELLLGAEVIEMLEPSL